MPEGDEGIFNLNAPAAVAAHGQAVSEAREILRTCDHFVLVATMPDGATAFGASADLGILVLSERLIHDQAVRVLEAEYDDYVGGEEQ